MRFSIITPVKQGLGRWFQLFLDFFRRRPLTHQKSASLVVPLIAWHTATKKFVMYVNAAANERNHIIWNRRFKNATRKPLHMATKLLFRGSLNANTLYVPTATQRPGTLGVNGGTVAKCGDDVGGVKQRLGRTVYLRWGIDGSIICMRGARVILKSSVC